MAVSRQLTVFCDGPECFAWEYVEDLTARGARKEVRAKHGWQRVRTEAGYVDLCPACVKDRSRSEGGVTE